MNFVDRVKIKIKAGDGGPGASSFRREKFVPKGGPDGGDGGQGGDVIFIATPKLQTLMDLTMKRIYKAENGVHGGKKNQFGLAGKHCILHVPVGTMVMDPEGNCIVDMTIPGQEVILAKGGKGGKGNQHFATSVNRAPRYAQTGLPGEEIDIVLEMRLIAEVGIVGLPNAGKSTLLKALTRANPKIADYPFTTLHPNLGVIKFPDREIVVADIPGLIEGASEGTGLGFDFLRHVDRTQTLIHLVALDPEDPQTALKDYFIVRKELEKSPFDLDQKPHIVVLNKVDIIEPSRLAEYQAVFKEKNIETLMISGVAKTGISELIVTLSQQVISFQK